MARTLIKGNKVAPVRLMNPSKEAQNIYKGTFVATLSAVDSIYENDGQSYLIEGCPSHLKDLYKRSVAGLTADNAKAVKDLLLRYSHLFAANDADLGRTKVIEHTIDTGTATPIKQHARRIPNHMQAEADQHVNDILKRGVIEVCSSPWSSPVVLVKKKDGTTRFCVDYRRLNNVTIKDAYPLPRIDDSLDQLSGTKFFSTLDLNAGYWQVEMADKDRAKTAFVTRNGLYSFKVMPFGLCNVPATFERLIESVLRGLQRQHCLG